MDIPDEHVDRGECAVVVVRSSDAEKPFSLGVGKCGLGTNAVARVQQTQGSALHPDLKREPCSRHVADTTGEGRGGQQRGWATCVAVELDSEFLDLF